MAITIKDYPTGINSLMRPLFFTYDTDTTYDLSFRFKYEVHLPATAYGVTPYSTSNIFSGISVPLENDLSYNTPHEIVKNVSEFNFNPEIDGIDRVQNNMIFFTEYITEIDKDGEGASKESNVILAIRNIDVIDSDDYTQGEGNTKFLNKITDHRLRITDDCTLRTLQHQGSHFKYVKYVATITGDSNSITKIEFKIENPYFDNCNTNSNTNLQWNGDNNVIEIQAGNFNGLTVIPLRYYDTSWHSATATSEDITITDNNIALKFTDTITANGELTSYTLQSFTDADAELSIEESFTIFQDCRFDSINVGWEDGLGGVDYFLFEKANERSITVDKTTFEQNLYTLNTTTSKVVENDYSKNNIIYSSKTIQQLEVSTDWLTQAQINNLEDLFKTNEVYLNYNSEWLYVLNTTKKATIYNKKKKGLKKYTIVFTFSKSVTI